VNRPHITVILPTYNPRPDLFIRTLDALQAQNIPPEQWELLIIDNASDSPLPDHPAIRQNRQCKIIKEDQRGLTAARCCGIKHALSDVLVFVDDDNQLNPSYLRSALKLMNCHTEVGACGGKVIPHFECSAPDWIQEFTSLLACQDFGDQAIFSDAFDGNYPKHSPVGAGMVIRHHLADSWRKQPARNITDRSGNSLSSGGDNDMILHVLKQHKRVGWFPELELEHFIPEARTRVSYLARLNYSIQKSWMELLTLHKINPWPTIPAWSIPLRQFKAWFYHKGWVYPVGFIRWRGACGHFTGRKFLGAR